MKLPIVSGRLAGRWWLPASRGKVLRILTGGYEREQTRVFEETLRPGDVVLDVGAHVGYYTLLSSVLVGETGRVWAFEPNPRNFSFLERHLRLNGRDNARALQAAVSDREGSARFDFGTGSGTGHLSDGGALEVHTIALDSFCAAQAIVPTAVKVDVEGAELSVLEGGRDLFHRHRPTIFLSTHGSEIHRRCLAWLAGAGYAFEPIVGGDVGTSSEILCRARGR